MSFSTLLFLFVFLPVSLIIYYVVPTKHRLIPLTVISLLFYAWGNPTYLILLLLSLAFNYVSALEIDARRESGQDGLKKFAMIVCVAADLLLLGFFKYLSFLISNLNLIPGLNLSAPDVSMPLGISFYTFTILSYILDVYRGRAKVQRNVLQYAAYATFFPKIISGPIVQYRDMEQELSTPKELNRDDLRSGALLLCIGLFKKVLISDNLGTIFNLINGLSAMSAGTAWLGMVLYSFQLYFDFSGYSDMAIGIAQLLGYHLAPNFNYPYRSVNITDFWRRWHISLGAWFREYVYFPLGGSRCSKPKLFRNLLVVWLLTGLWHGASWSFILWGLWHGLFSMLERFVIKDKLDHVPHPLRVLGTCLIAFIGWVMFFSENLHHMVFYFGQMFGAGHMGLFGSSFLYYFKSSFILLVIAVIGSGPFVQNFVKNVLYHRIRIRSRRIYIATGVCAVLLILSVACMVSATYSSFLYFQF